MVINAALHACSVPVLIFPEHSKLRGLADKRQSTDGKRQRVCLGSETVAGKNFWFDCVRSHHRHQRQGYTGKEAVRRLCGYQKATPSLSKNENRHDNNRQTEKSN